MQIITSKSCQDCRKLISEYQYKKNDTLCNLCRMKEIPTICRGPGCHGKMRYDRVFTHDGLCEICYERK